MEKRGAEYEDGRDQETYKANIPYLSIEDVQDNSDETLPPADKRPESWQVGALPSLDSAVSLAGNPAALSENNVLLMSSGKSRCSSISSTISESLVDAEQAGILGGMINDHAPWKQSCDSLPTGRGDSLARHNGKQSIVTDPGPYGHDNGHGRNMSSYGSTVGEDHENFILMYDMLTGIRHSVSVCQAKPCRPLSEEDFKYART
ncbi:hypothetical protein PSACC_02979 [Paramicrosporidium saccamoebae]|uniref:Uncharacterized protein n=1 Tax=Paramicrosporidium saccamoebae TaxID=1246581 RepID=A0A2H9THI8_9FUNG|nr:hypothetical protein PSACC_02979 [Paramicrosporidium saccamoebae]